MIDPACLLLELTGPGNTALRSNYLSENQENAGRVVQENVSMYFFSDYCDVRVSALATDHSTQELPLCPHCPVPGPGLCPRLSWIADMDRVDREEYFDSDQLCRIQDM